MDLSLPEVVRRALNQLGQRNGGHRHTNPSRMGSGACFAVGVVQVVGLSAMVCLLCWRSVQVWRNATEQFGPSVQRVVPAYTIGLCAMLGTGLLVVAVPNDGGGLADSANWATLPDFASRRQPARSAAGHG